MLLGWCDAAEDIIETSSRMHGGRHYSEELRCEPLSGEQSFVGSAGIESHVVLISAVGKIFSEDAVLYFLFLFLSAGVGRIWCDADARTIEHAAMCYTRRPNLLRRRAIPQHPQPCAVSARPWLGRAAW